MVRRAVLAVLVIVALALLTISFRSPTSGVLHDAQSYGASALRPFQVAAVRVARPFRDAYTYVDSLTKAKSDLAKYKKLTRNYRAQALLNAGAVQKLNDLERLMHYESGPTYPKDYRAVNAAVLSFPSGSDSEQIVIDAGTTSGVHLNTPVVGADGLVGRVTTPGRTSSVVTLLTDPDSAVPARDLKTRVSGLIRHGQGGTLILDRVPKNEIVNKGDWIVTRGTVDRRYPDEYPYGIPIGRVVAVGTSDIASFLTVQVQPLADVDSLDSVAALVPKGK
ncbi:MAG: rod shape-determining protein MreC [Actinobacteria bacterium]|nr:rod shape-determining protein MreC [Actinomycetota bacterium]